MPPPESSVCPFVDIVTSDQPLHCSLLKVERRCVSKDTYQKG
jgi:hypothetical protein